MPHGHQEGLFENPFSDFFEDPGLGQQAAFFARQPEELSFNEQRLFENQFGRFQRQFLGDVGRQIIAGETPTERFGDLVGRTDFDEVLGSIPPGLRFGGGTSQFAPPTTFGF